MRQAWNRSAGWFAGAMAFSLAGCGDKLADLPGVQQVKQALTNTVEDVKQSTGQAGHIEIDLGSPVQTSGCYASFYSPADQRSSVLQVASYNDVSGESFPSFFFRALTTQKTPSRLAGQTLQAVLFVQESQDGPVWMTPTGESIALSITTADDQSLTGQFKGELLNAETGARKSVQGKLNGSLKKAGA